MPLEDLCTLGSKHYVLHFDQFLKPKSEWAPFTPPRVMVNDSEWGEVCRGLVESGVCTFIEEEEVFDTGSGPLLNGLFGVTKDEWTEDGTEIFRLIMNLVPLNSLCMPMNGDVDTLPSWAGMSPYFLQPTQNLIVSSEDVKCFFYTMSVPTEWRKYLAFNKRVPREVLPDQLKDRVVYVASRVLPMGFLNSVSLAQHVHRNLVEASGRLDPSRGINAPEHELRKDRPFASNDSVWRVYLDNYDLLEKVEATSLVDVKGSCAPGVLCLRQEYEHCKVPRNIKKSVQRSDHCEMQGATIDGTRGVAYPRESKLCKYFSVALKLCEEQGATQRQWQVACGGLVYFSMFRRPLLGSLNRVWTHIGSYSSSNLHWQVTPPDCKLELLRFLGCLPLARIDFRLDMHPIVTCSDASSTGSGFCATRSVSACGEVVSRGALRGELAGSRTEHAIVSIGLFDGIGGLRVCLDLLGVRVLGHVSVEKDGAVKRVVESHFPHAVMVDSVEEITEELVRLWATKFSQCSLVLIGAGPPCQGVSGLNSDRKGALLDQRSCLFQHVPRIRDLVRKQFCWCPVYTMMESVASMDRRDCALMSDAVGVQPLSCNAGEFTWCQRPRLYWCDWEITGGTGCNILESADDSPIRLQLQGQQNIAEVTRKGWYKVEPGTPFPTFTTSRPQAKPGRKPAGILQCTPSEIERWQADNHRFPPYQYQTKNCLVNQRNLLRVPDVPEREMMMGFPLHYTAACLPKGLRNGAGYNDARLSLLGNSWSIPVVTWLIGQLLRTLGLGVDVSPQQILDSLSPGVAPTVQGRLVRLPLNPPAGASESPLSLIADESPL